MSIIEQLKKKQGEGKIKGFVELKPKSKLPAKTPDSKRQLELILFAFACSKGLELTKEHKFHDERKWRFDFCFRDHKVAIEYEGLMSEKSGHTTLAGYTKNTEKYNAATIAGWKVLRYTWLNYKNASDDLKKLSWQTQ